MTYFNYHAKIKQKICSGELKSYHFDLHYKNIGFALVLNFTDKSYPIREHKFSEYFKLIGKHYSITKKGQIFCTTFLKHA